MRIGVSTYVIRSLDECRRPAPGAPIAVRSVRARSVRSDAPLPSSFLFLVVRMLLVARPGAPSSVLAPSSDGLCS